MITGKLGTWSAAALLAMTTVARAADHNDGPAATADPSADIADFFLWTSPDGTRVNLAMTYFPFATATAKQSASVQYVFHTRSLATAAATTSTPQDVICQFDAQENISCWAGDSFVTGNAKSKQGLTSADGKMRVFAGLRDDPFFFNLTGFKQTAKAVTAALPTLPVDAAGCPTLDPAAREALVAQLAHGANGAAPADDFALKNVLALVVTLDKSVLNKGGPLIAAYAATHQR